MYCLTRHSMHANILCAILIIFVRPADETILKLIWDSIWLPKNIQIRRTEIY